MGPDSGARANGDASPTPPPDESQEVTHVYEGAVAAAAPPPSLAAGARLRHYRIIRELGRGGQGLVLLARDEALRRLVALKTLTVVGAVTPGALRRFHNEGRAVAGLRHPNIVQLYEVFDEGGLPFMAMEFVEGRSLLDAIRGGLLPRLQVIEIMAQCCGAVGYAHERGLVHRDLKPHNIMLTHEGVPKIMDFGLAKYFTEPADRATGTVDGHVVGSPAYMAPEQAAGRRREVGPHTDVYALGVTLYQCLTGALPHSAETPAATLYRILHESPEPLCARDPTIGSDLAAICARAMEKNPADRYPTASDMADDLRCYLNNEPVSARAASLMTRMVKSVTRNREFALSFGVTATLTALALSVLLGLSVHRDALHVAETARTELKSIALTATLLFPAEEVTRVRGQEDENDAAYNDLLLRLNLLRRRNPRIQSAFLLRKSERSGELYYVAHADARVQDGSIVLRRPGEYFRAAPDSAPHRAFAGPAADAAPVRGPWRTTLSGYAPIADEGGRVVAVLGVEMGVEQFGGDARRAMVGALAQVGLVAGILFALMSLYAFVRIRRRRRSARFDE